MEIRNNLFYLVLAVFTMNSCLQSSDNRFTKAWKNDKYGCQNSRSVEYFEKIKEKLKLTNLTEKELFNKLGKSDSVFIRKDFKLYNYYFDGICDNEKIVDTSDYCFVQFKLSLRTSKIENFEQICY